MQLLGTKNSASQVFWDQLNLTLGIEDYRKYNADTNYDRARQPAEYIPSEGDIIPTPDEFNVVETYKKELMNLRGSLLQYKTPTLSGKFQHITDTINHPFDEIPLKIPVNETAFIYSYFTNIRLVGKHIKNVDKEMQKFKNVKELVLTANQLSNLDQQFLPNSLTTLFLDTNHFLQPPNLNGMKNLFHLGMSYNYIKSVGDPEAVVAETRNTPRNLKKSCLGNLSLAESSRPATKIGNSRSIWFPPNLRSLDLAYNNLIDLEKLLLVLSNCHSLRSLALLGNPACLVEEYGKHVVKNLSRLQFLDDNPVSTLDDSSQDTSVAGVKGEYNPNCRILFQVNQLKDLPKPPLLPHEDLSLPPDEYKFGFRFKTDGFDRTTTNFCSWQEEPIMVFNPLVETFPIGLEARDAVRSGVCVQLVRSHIKYVLKEEVKQAANAKDKKKGAGAAAPSKKKKVVFSPEELALSYDATTFEEKVLWKYVISTKKFLEGQTLVEKTIPITISPKDTLEGSIPPEGQQQQQQQQQNGSKKGAKKKANEVKVEEKVPLQTEVSLEIILHPVIPTQSSGTINTSPPP